MQKTFIRKPVSVLLSLLIVLCAFGAASFTAWVSSWEHSASMLPSRVIVQTFSSIAVVMFITYLPVLYDFAYLLSGIHLTEGDAGGRAVLRLHSASACAATRPGGASLPNSEFVNLNDIIP